MTMLLEVRGLITHFFTPDGTIQAVDGVDFCLQQGHILGIVGESGCGKSVTALSLLQLIGPPGRIIEGQAFWEPGADAIDLLALKPSSARMRSVRGAEIGMVFQEPLSSLSLLHTIGDQITEDLLVHRKISKIDAEMFAASMLQKVGLPDPRGCLKSYPFQLSGGMRQRVLIAIALICSPQLLIADEPTTALDVTTQAQVIELIRELQSELGLAVLFITHNLSLVAELCTEAVVMYCGKIVEQAGVDALFHDPQHPYTRALLKSMPHVGMKRGTRLPAIPGSMPDPVHRPTGCPFHPRCAQSIPAKCDCLPPPISQLADGRKVRCWLYPVP